MICTPEAKVGQELKESFFQNAGGSGGHGVKLSKVCSETGLVQTIHHGLKGACAAK